MDFQRRTFKTLARYTARPGHRLVREPGEPVRTSDWNVWLRLIERKRRLLAEANGRAHPLPREFLAGLTYGSFALEGLDVTELEVAQAISNGPARRSLRSRQCQRIRNHAAILRRIESCIRLGESLKSSAVVRWYTSISCGLSTTSLDDATMTRLDVIVRRINSPRMRLQPAVQEIAHVHAGLIADPLAPSFNGILARLLLRYHLGRCGLPPVLFDPQADAKTAEDESTLLARLMDLIDESYNVLLKVEG